MHPNLVLCIFATAFVLIQCEFKYTACSPVEDDNPHDFKDESCVGQEFESLFEGDVMGKFPAPQALEKFVKLAGNYEYRPSMVIVKRCDGQCDGELTLQAVETTNRVFPVIQTEDGELPECVSVEVEEHTKCACKCLKNERACREPLKLLQETCTCECPDKYEHAKRNCERDNRKIKYWNSTTCSCECKEYLAKMKCMTNSHTWDEKACKCKKLK